MITANLFMKDGEREREKAVFDYGQTSDAILRETAHR